jgi:hypothetical protein
MPGVQLEVPADTAIYTTDRDSRYSGTGYLQCYTKPGMPTIYLDDTGPPECHLCQGLAKVICRNCHQLVCPEHSSGSDLCRSCAGSSWVGLVVAVLAIGLFCLFVWLIC